MKKPYTNNIINAIIALGAIEIGVSGIDSLSYRKFYLEKDGKITYKVGERGSVEITTEKENEPKVVRNLSKEEKSELVRKGKRTELTITITHQPETNKEEMLRIIGQNLHQTLAAPAGAVNLTPTVSFKWSTTT